MKKKTLHDFNKMKKENIPASWITAYDYPLAQAAEKAEVDMILVGDSGGMVQLGYDNTHPVTMDEMIMMAKAVRRGAPNTFIIGDMPQGSYEISEEDAVKNALRFIKEAGCDAVKCEGGARVLNKLKAIIDAGIVVFGHLGLTPQSTESFGGYRVQGKTKESFSNIFKDALHLQSIGIHSLLLEAMPSEPAGRIAKQLNIPVYGIGAGEEVDGQLLIMHDLLGFYSNFRPHFAKCYIPDVVKDFWNFIVAETEDFKDFKEFGKRSRNDGLLLLSEIAIKAFVQDVKVKKFPGKEYSYSMTDEELSDVKKSQYWDINDLYPKEQI